MGGRLSQEDLRRGLKVEKLTALAELQAEHGRAIDMETDRIAGLQAELEAERASSEQVAGIPKLPPPAIPTSPLLIPPQIQAT